MNKNIVKETEERFLKLFNEKPLLVRSPGRINLIGEHTDYNDGFVLPAAIDRAVYLGITAREDKQVRIYSSEFRDTYITSLDLLKPAPLMWPNYILGVADQLIKRNYAISGFNLVIDGDVPIGSGLSSSAAVECATAFALNQVFDLGLTKMELATISQKAEHEFAGVLCGIMDQFASVFGKKDHVIRLDCRSLEYEYLPLNLKGFSIVLLNSNVKHSLASSAYNTRRMECHRGVEMIKKQFPEVKSLRDASLPMLDDAIKPFDQLIYKRCQYVVEENIRLNAASDALRKNDIDLLGQKMFETHQGLSLEYEVSCPELDFLVNLVRDNPAVIGSRMMGGGFGGCTINIVRNDMVEKLIADASRSYQNKMNKELTAYVAATGDGSSLISI